MKRESSEKSPIAEYIGLTGMTKKDYSIKQLLLEDAEPRPKLGEKPARNCNITTKTAREIAMAALT